MGADFAGLHGRASGLICKCPCSYRIHHVLLLLPSHLQKTTSNRDCPQHLPCIICCPLLGHQKTQHHPTSSPRTCPLPAPFLHNSCHPSEVFEDNNSAYLLAMNHNLSEHSKHLNVKRHFFWEYVDEGHVKISKCSTEEQ